MPKQFPVLVRLSLLPLFALSIGFRAPCLSAAPTASSAAGRHYQTGSTHISPAPVLPAPDFGTTELPNGSGPGAEISVRVIDGALLEQRLVIDGVRLDDSRDVNERSRVFVAYGYADGGTEYLSGGISIPELTAGTVRLQGLLREIQRPTRFSPSSDVYRERPTLVLDSAMAPTSRLGVQLQPWSAAPALLATVRDNAAESVGLAMHYAAGPVIFSALLRTGDAAPEPQDTVWYTEYPRFPGGRVHHAAAQLGLAGGALRLSGMTAVSSGPLVAPSSAVRVYAHYRAHTVRATGLWAVTRPGYVTPDGRFWRDAHHLAAAVRVGRTRGPALELEGSHRETRAPLRSGRVAPTRTDVFIRIGCHGSDWGLQRVTATAGLRVSEQVDERNRDLNSISAETALAAERPIGGDGRLSARVNGRRDWENGAHERDRLEATVTVGRGQVALDSRLLLNLGEGATSYAGRVELRARAGALRLYVRAATLEEVTVEDVAQLRSVPLIITIGGLVGFTIPRQPGTQPRRGVEPAAPTTLQPAVPRAQE